MRNYFLMVIFMMMVSGCAGNTVIPDSNQPGSETNPYDLRQTSEYDSPHRLWGEWTLLINEERDSVDIIPVRNARIHLNALKYLEEQCDDCLEINDIQNNGDSTIDLTLEIKHPWPGLPQYTGFDVKGIIMFNGSHEIPDNLEKLPLYPQNYRLSWRLMGDPELLNADGYTYHWSPWHDTESDLPMFNYVHGKYAAGTPTANINGFLNFYSNEDRHMFEVDAVVERTYHIWLPTGPVAAGYAIEACWEPPINTPVTNPVEDFPITANQPEAYHFRFVVNDGNVITMPYCCNVQGTTDVYGTRQEVKKWYILPYEYEHSWVGAWDAEIGLTKVGYQGDTCGEDIPPEHPDWRCMGGHIFGAHPDGVYQLIAWESNHYLEYPSYKMLHPGFYVLEIEIDIE